LKRKPTMKSNTPNPRRRIADLLAAFRRVTPEQRAAYMTKALRLAILSRPPRPKGGQDGR
jgi:hypothetical protein